MYRKLLPLMQRFVFIRQGAYNRYYEGKLIALDPESVQIQAYRKDGTPEEIWTISLDSISEFSVGGRHLAEIELKVSFMSSAYGEETEEEEAETVSDLATASQDSSSEL
jgi:hypothetical protein